MKALVMSNIMKKRKVILLGLIVTIFASCASNNMIQTELYFGLTNNSGEISNERWNDFKEKSLEVVFVGYSELDCNGYWKNSIGEKYNENSKLIIYIHEKSTKEQNKIDSIINVYKMEFNQESVLEINKAVQVNFK